MRSLLSDYLAAMDTIGFVPIFRNEIVGIKRWIDRHVSDYSAIHTILALSQAAVQSGNLSLTEIITEEDILGHAISLVQDYPAHEALWMYTRMTLSILNLQQAPQIQQFVDHFVQPLVHSQHPKTEVVDALVNASQYARQFLNRNLGCNFS